MISNLSMHLSKVNEVIKSKSMIKNEVRIERSMDLNKDKTASEKYIKGYL